MKSLPTPNLIPNVTDLGQGEAEVIAIGLLQPGSLLVLDDALGRQIAQLHQLQYTGTLGILIRAKQLELLPAVLPVITQLQAKGMWLSDTLIQIVLQKVNE